MTKTDLLRDIYPKYFQHKITLAYFKRSRKLSADDTPRYEINPNSEATYHISHFQTNEFEPKNNKEAMTDLTKEKEIALFNAELSLHENRMLSVGEITNKFYKKYPEYDTYDKINYEKTDEVLRYEYFLKIRKEADRKIDMFFQFWQSEKNNHKTTLTLINEFETLFNIKR